MQGSEDKSESFVSRARQVPDLVDVGLSQVMRVQMCACTEQKIVESWKMRPKQLCRAYIVASKVAHNVLSQETGTLDRVLSYRR